MHQSKHLIIGLHLLFLYALLLLADFSKALLQVVTALQSLLKLSLHVVYLKEGEEPSVHKPSGNKCMTDERERLQDSVPPRPSPSPGERSYSPSKPSGTPADWSAGTSTADTEDSWQHLSADLANKATTKRDVYLQLKRVNFLSVAGVSLTLVLHHLPVGLAGHQPMHVVIYDRTDTQTACKSCCHWMTSWSYLILSADCFFIVCCVACFYCVFVLKCKVRYK